MEDSFILEEANDGIKKELVLWLLEGRLLILSIANGHQRAAWMAPFME